MSFGKADGDALLEVRKIYKTQTLIHFETTCNLSVDTAPPQVFDEACIFLYKKNCKKKKKS